MQHENKKVNFEQNSYPITNIVIIFSALIFLGTGLFLYIRFDGKNARIQGLQASETKSAIDLSGKLASVSEGQTAPNFTLSDTSGKNFSLNNFTGKPTLVVFEATWCTFCHQQNNDVEKIREDFKDKLNVVSIDLREDVGTVLNAWQQRNNARLVLIDADGKVGTSYGITSTPTNIFLKANATVAFKHPGLMGYDQMKEVINDLI